MDFFKVPNHLLGKKFKKINIGTTGCSYGINETNRFIPYPKFEMHCRPTGKVLN